MQINILELAVGALAVWRLTHLVHAEDGPWDSFARLRRRASGSMLGKMLDCFYCASVWAAVPIAAVLSVHWTEWLLLWPALSGAAILIERATARSQQPLPAAEWFLESEEKVLQGETG